MRPARTPVKEALRWRPAALASSTVADRSRGDAGCSPNAPYRLFRSRLRRHAGVLSGRVFAQVRGNGRIDRASRLVSRLLARRRERRDKHEPACGPARAGQCRVGSRASGDRRDVGGVH
ncbi:hypothetical protein AKJ09_03407 [Labilithrix luteola]|uniref:Uncharacterized protein n=1 Tax=Labilithrix luteola TaxID=1391654 RepID=A0A0K1PT84_9BACT|nr:hypothetical protein AKJ09_03407 [Labilithrix luteola]